MFFHREFKKNANKKNTRKKEGEGSLFFPPFFAFLNLNGEIGVFFLLKENILFIISRSL